jgi:hypothetical protein
MDGKKGETGLYFYRDKKIYVVLEDNRKYSGICQEVIFLGSGYWFLTIIDKFGEYVSFSSNEIKYIETENNPKLKKEKNGK